MENKRKKTVSKILDKLSGLSLFMIFFGLPIFFTGLAFQGIVFEKQIYFYFWLLLGSVSWMIKGAVERKISVRRTPLDIFIIGFWLAYLLATVFSVDRWHSFWGAFGDPSRGLLNITALVVAYYFIFSNFSLGRLRLILGALVGSGLVVSLWTLLAISNVPVVPSSLAPFLPLSLIGSVTGLGTFLSGMIILLSFAILKISEEEEMEKGRRRIFLAILFFNLALDLFLAMAFWNFIPWLALLVGTTIFLILTLAKIVRPRRGWKVFPVALFVIILVLRMAGAADISKTAIPTELSLNYKSAWDIAGGSLKDNFFLGTGPDTYGYDFSLYHSRDTNSNAFYNFRFFQGPGIFFEAIPTVGAAGTLLLFMIIIFSLSAMIYFIRRGEDKEKLYSLGFFCTFTVFLAALLGTREDGTIYLVTALLGIVTLAIIFKEGGAKEKYIDLPLKASPEFAIALVFLFIIAASGLAYLFVSLGKIYAADIYAGDAHRKFYRGKGEDSLLQLSKAIDLYPQESGYYLQSGQYHMALTNQEAGKDMEERDLSKVHELLNSSIDVTSKGMNISKNDVKLIENLARIYENAREYIPNPENLAIETYQKGLELEPRNPDFYLKIGQLKMGLATSSKDDNQRQRMLREAKESFRKAIEEKNNYGQGYLHLSAVQEALGDIDGAIESGRKALETDPKNENYILALARLYQTKGNEGDKDIVEQLYKYAITLNDASENGHFYLGLFYEENGNREGAKEEYRKVLGLLGDSSPEGKKQIEKMISNVDAGIRNTSENLGLTQSQEGGIPAQESGNQSPAGRP